MATTGRLNRIPMRHRIRTPMFIPTREATTVPFRTRGVKTKEVCGAVATGAATEAFFRHSGRTCPAIHQRLHHVRAHRSRRGFEKGGNVWGRATLS